jgi:hypothetical protein
MAFLEVGEYLANRPEDQGKITTDEINEVLEDADVKVQSFKVEVSKEQFAAIKAAEAARKAADHKKKPATKEKKRSSSKPKQDKSNEKYKAAVLQARESARQAAKDFLASVC